MTQPARATLLTYPRDRAPFFVLRTLGFDEVRWEDPLHDPLPRLTRPDVPFVLSGAAVTLAALRRGLWRYAPLVSVLSGELSEVDMLLPDTGTDTSNQNVDLFKLRALIYVHPPTQRPTWPRGLRSPSPRHCAQTPDDIAREVLRSLGVRRPRAARPTQAGMSAAR